MPDSGTVLYVGEFKRMTYSGPYHNLVSIKYTHHDEGESEVMDISEISNIDH